MYAESSRVIDLDRDLVATVEWTGDWALGLNVAKCSVVHFGPGTASSIIMSVNDEVHLLSVAQKMRGLVAFFASNLDSSEQIDRLEARAKESCSCCSGHIAD